MMDASTWELIQVGFLLGLGAGLGWVVFEGICYALAAIAGVTLGLLSRR